MQVFPCTILLPTYMYMYILYMYSNMYGIYQPGLQIAYVYHINKEVFPPDLG